MPDMARFLPLMRADLKASWARTETVHGCRNPAVLLTPVSPTLPKLPELLARLESGRYLFALEAALMLSPGGRNWR